MITVALFQVVFRAEQADALTWANVWWRCLKQEAKLLLG